MHSHGSPGKDKVRTESLSAQRKQCQISDSLREESREVLATMPDRDGYLERVLDLLGDEEDIQDYISGIASLPDLESGELDTLLKDRFDADKGARARKKLNEANLRLVVWFAKDYAGGDLLIKDLIHEGTVGLLRAVNTFEGNGFTFREYASCLIKETISFAVAEETRSVRVPNYILEKISAVKLVTRKLATEKGLEPSYDEIAKAMGLTLSELERLVGLAKIPASKEEEGMEEVDPQDLEINLDLDEYDDLD